MAWKNTASGGRTSISALLSKVSAPRLQALFNRDPPATANWVRVIAADGLPEAQVCYGRMLLEGTGVSKDTAAALGWFRRAAASGDADGLNMVGRCLENGWGTSIDLAAAARNYHEAADAGHAWAQYNLGHLYLDGTAVSRDAERAFFYYLQAARQQHPRAMNLAGRCCEEGWGTTRDLCAAAGWYRKSAESGYFRGQFNWATLLLHARREGAAALWFERAANGGTKAVREAVLSTLDRCNPGEALRGLALRLRCAASNG